MRCGSSGSGWPDTIVGVIAFNWDISELAFWQNMGVDRALVQATRKAGSDALRFLRVDSSRRVRNRKRFKVAKVNKGLPLAFPRSSRTLDDLEWRMDISGETMPLAAFSYRQTRKGVTFSVNVAKRGFIKSAFVATMDSGHKGVFFRTGKARLPIDEAFTTKLSDVFKDEHFIPIVQTGAQAKFNEAFGRLIYVEIEKEFRAKVTT